MQKKDFVSLAEARPDLAAEWNYEKNGDLRPEDVGVHSHKKVWWFQYDVSPITGKKMKLEWNAIIDNRVKGAGNPIKSGYLAAPEYNDLASLRPDLAKEWNYEKNGKLTPNMVTCGSPKKVWWIQYDMSPVTGKIIKLEWQASINNRVKGTDCPIKAGRQVLKGYNDLASLRPDLAAEWNYEKNGKLTPDMVTCGSGKNIWWMQYDTSPITGKLMKLEWKDTINNRTNGKGYGNPIKSGRRTLKGYNDLASLRPDLAAEWNYKRNNKLTPEMVTCGCNKKVWWIQYDISPITGETMALEWKATVASRVSGMGNPIKSGYQVLKGYNDLASLRPDLASEWDYKKNGKLTPDTVTCGCHKNVWWVQYDINPVTQERVKLEWKSTIKNRVNGNGNPYKSGKAVLKGYNDLASLRPDLAKEWNYEKNGKLTPDMITCGYDKKVWWIFSFDDLRTGKHFDYEWQAYVYSRTKGSGCPYLSTSKGEEYIKQYLQKNNITFTPQQKFPDLIGTGGGQLSYDFSILSDKYGFILIEYNGLQHYQSCEFFGGEEKFKKQKEHDKLKKEYAKKHGYKLIVVKYTYDTYEDVAEYMEKELKKIDKSILGEDEIKKDAKVTEKENVA